MPCDPSSEDVIYKCDCKYYPKNQKEIIWNDPFIGIKWLNDRGNGQRPFSVAPHGKWA